MPLYPYLEVSDVASSQRAVLDQWVKAVVYLPKPADATVRERRRRLRLLPVGTEEKWR